jgi:murein L,D-transpeptidase YcbB/YkuD
VKVKFTKFNIYISFLLFGVFVLFSCQSKSRFDHIKNENPAWFSKYSFYSDEAYYSFFRNYVSQYQDTSSLVYPQLVHFYQNADPFWTSFGLQQENIEDFLTIIDSSNTHGLPKEMFFYSKIKTLYDSVTSLHITDKKTLFTVLSTLEIELTNAYLHYSKVLAFGATDPTTIHPQKWLYQMDTLSFAFYENSLKSIDNFSLYIDSISPKSITYKALQNELRKYSVISDTAILDTFNHTKTYFVDKIIANLERNRWRVSPSKGRNYIVVNIPDFMVKGYIQDSCYVSLKICCGLTLTKSEREKSTLMNHVYPSGKWETPLLNSSINYLVLNPEWNIPYSIMKDEYLVKLQKNNLTIIQKEKLMVYDRTRNRVEPDTIDWKRFSKKNIPYTLVQTSGKHNALGIIKFDFPNPESVYLHDTPNKGAFKRKNRAVSHGCCRVENPMDLAHFIFKYNELSEYEIEKINIVLGFTPTSEQGVQYLDTLLQAELKNIEKLTDLQKKFYRSLRPTRYKLNKQIPIFIEYFTCFLNENGEIQYCDDVYYKDYGIINQLNEYKK